MSVGGAELARALPVSPTPARPSAVAGRAALGAGELLVVDARVPHRDVLAAAARQGVETLVLEVDRDGLAQIDAAVRGREFAAIHLVAHGRPGVIELGSTRLDARTATASGRTLSRWFVARAPHEARPEVLVYACEAASGPDGAALLQALARATGADVAGSTDRTGGAALGADWALEASIGSIEARLPIAPSVALAYPATLETFTVSTAAASGAGSLAQAVADANANANAGESDQILFQGVTGTITLDAALAVSEPLAIVGPGASALTIAGNGAGRLFEASSTLALANLTLANGAADGDGGAVRVEGASLVVERCVLSGNAASASGGAIAATDASVVIADSLLEGNAAADGGALFASLSSLDIEGTTLRSNEATGNGGAIAIESAIAFIDDSLVVGNGAGGQGGGIDVAHAGGGAPLLSVENSTISGNVAESGGGIAAAGDTDAELVHVTVADNTISGTSSRSCIGAGVDGCGLSGPGIVIVESSILARNGAGGGQGVDLAGDALDLELEIRASLIGIVEGGVATSGEPIFGEDPLLGPLADNGGTSFTHALSTGSPAIDGGENPGALGHDQRGAGFPRVIGAAADMGAYEWSPDDDPSTGDGGTDVDGGTGLDGGTGPKDVSTDDNCGCSVPGAGEEDATTPAGVTAALLGLLGLARRRSARRR